MDYTAEFLNEPSEEDMSRFFALEREITTLALSPEQRSRRDDILRHITQFLGSRSEFVRFLAQLEKLRDEVRSENERPAAPEAKGSTPANERFSAYLNQFERADEERLRQMIREELDKLPKDYLVFLYTVIIGSVRCFSPDDGSSSTRR